MPELATVSAERLRPIVERYKQECGLPGRRDRDPRHLRRRIDKVLRGERGAVTLSFADRLLVDMDLPHLFEDVV